MRLVFLNRCYWPDAEATGQLLTDLAEFLAQRNDVTVVVGQPNVTADQRDAQFLRTGEQTRHGVRIRRVLHWQLPKRKYWMRLLNLLSFTRAALRELRRLPRPDLVICETDPFFLPLVTARYARQQRIPFVVYLQDLYPDVAIAVGAARENPMTVHLRQRLLAAYRSSQRTIVLSEGMRQRLVSWGLPASKISIIPNWVDCERIHPWTDGPNPQRAALGADESTFLVMHSGNMGNTQPLDVLLRAAADAAFPVSGRIALVGGGSREQALKRLVANEFSTAAHRIGFYPYRPQSDLAASLSAADVQVIASDPRVDGCLAPSKLYGILAAGRPLLVIGSSTSDAARLVQSEDLGEVAPPQPTAVAEALARLADQPRRRESIAQRARQLARASYDRSIVLPQLESTFTEAISQTVGRDGA